MFGVNVGKYSIHGASGKSIFLGNSGNVAPLPAPHGKLGIYSESVGKYGYPQLRIAPSPQWVDHEIDEIWNDY